MACKYSIGIDFGTLSARAVVADVGSGKIAASAEKEYAHGVMDEYLSDTGIKLKSGWALQDPQDYIDAMTDVVPEALKASGVDAADIIGIAADFTSCTVLSLDKDGLPLCFKKQFRERPHSYAFLWKHHASQPQATRLTETAALRGEAFLKRYGGKISSEWLFPKIMQILEEAPDVFEAVSVFAEGSDWISYLLTGRMCKNSCAAGFKALWSKRGGYPSADFFAALDPRLRYIVDEKLGREINPIGGRAGLLTAAMASKLGLLPGTPVGISIVDGHSMVPAAGITSPGKMLLIMGTSLVNMILAEEELEIPGICGIVEDGIIPGYYCYEAGQAGGGDHFEWFIENCLPAEYAKEAEERKISVHRLLREKAVKLKPAESGLLALDWWNGNRSVLVDADLTGMILGCTLATKPEEIYRALMEALAFGTNMIIETFEKNGVHIDELCACGGIAEKDTLMMQIYADVTGRSIRITPGGHTAALGAAILAAVAAGKSGGGYDTITEAVAGMSGADGSRDGESSESAESKISIGNSMSAESVASGSRGILVHYDPIPANTAIYSKLYNEYVKLHDYFGRGAAAGGNDIMHILRHLRSTAE